MIEPPHQDTDERLQIFEMIISEISVEARVDRCNRRDSAPSRPAYRAMTDDIGCGDVDDVGLELGKILPNARP